MDQSLNLSMNVPEATVQRLRERATRGHQSLQEELLDIVEAATREEPANGVADIVAAVRRLGLSTPSESVDMIREDRDCRQDRS